MLNTALEEVISGEQVKKVRLVTLANHSEGKEMMSSARRLYEKNSLKFIAKRLSNAMFYVML